MWYIYTYAGTTLIYTELKIINKKVILINKIPGKIISNFRIFKEIHK